MSPAPPLPLDTSNVQYCSILDIGKWSFYTLLFSRSGHNSTNIIPSALNSPLNYISELRKICIALKLYRVVSKNELKTVCLHLLWPRPVFTEDSCQRISNLNSSLCYQTRVKLHSFLQPGLTGNDGQQVDSRHPSGSKYSALELQVVQG